MTEIPEHLLKRSKERRQAVSGSGEAGTSAAPGAPAAEAAGSGAGAEGTASAAAPVRATAAARPARPQPAAPPPPKPQPPYVVAAQLRRRIPLWAMPVLIALPIWAFIYMEAMSPAKAAANTPLAVGARVFATCAACHGGAGEGGAGYKLSEGEVLKTFPKIEDQILFVANGSPIGSVPYGSASRPGGQRVSGSLNGGKMPAWKDTFSISEIVGAVCHERFSIAGAKPDDPQWQQQYNDWCAPDAPKYVAAQADGAKTLSDLGAAAGKA